MSDDVEAIQVEFWGQLWVPKKHYERLRADRDQFERESCERFQQLDAALARIEELQAALSKIRETCSDKNSHYIASVALGLEVSDD
jgi:hypothetical protein